MSLKFASDMSDIFCFGRMEKTPFAVVTVFLVLCFSLELQGNVEKTTQHFVFGGSNYTFHVSSARSLNWEESRLACKNTGSDLVGIESLKEWRFLNKSIRALETTEYFIGLRKNGKQGEWRWISDNSIVNATRGIFPWAKDEPSGDGDCTVMYKDYRKDYGEYNDLSCTIEQRPGYICERPAQRTFSNKEDDTRTCRCVAYSVHHKRLTWNSSRAWCQKDGGDLVSIETDKEWNYLTDFIQNLTNSKHAEYHIRPLKRKALNWHWLSNNKQVPDQGWRWQVNTLGDGDCVVMYKYYQEKNGYFSDLSCSCRVAEENKNLSCSSRGKEEVSREFICEKTFDCNCVNGRILNNQLNATASSDDVDSAVSSSSQKDNFLFMLAIAIGSLDVVLLIVTVMLFLGIRRHQSAKRHPVLSRKKAKN